MIVNWRQLYFYPCRNHTFTMIIIICIIKIIVVYMSMWTSMYIYLTNEDYYDYSLYYYWTKSAHAHTHTYTHLYSVEMNIHTHAQLRMKMVFLWSRYCPYKRARTHRHTIFFCILFFSNKFCSSSLVWWFACIRLSRPNGNAGIRYRRVWHEPLTRIHSTQG